MLTRENQCKDHGMENYTKFVRGETGGVKLKMKNYGSGERLIGKDNNSSPDDPEERAVLEEHLYWARMERQKLLALSAEADETIWNLATLVQRTMQERDEATNKARMILANVQARNARMMTLAGRAHSRTATGSSQQAFASPRPTPFRASSEMMMMQGQHARTGARCCVASSSNFGHMNLASSMGAYFDRPPLHSFTSLVQEPFDPDMFLVDAVKSPQDAVPDAAGTSGLEKSSGVYGHLAQQWKGKSVLRQAADHGQAP